MGDTDIFGVRAGLFSNLYGRECSAVCGDETAVFVMTGETLDVIENKYPEVYNEMKERAILRFKKH